MHGHARQKAVKDFAFAWAHLGASRMHDVSTNGSTRTQVALSQSLDCAIGPDPTTLWHVTCIKISMRRHALHVANSENKLFGN